MRRAPSVNGRFRHRRAASPGTVLTLAGCVAGFACGNAPPVEEEAIRIGLIAELTGDFKLDGERLLAGAELAVQEINDAGGVPIGETRRRIELITEDSQDSPDRAVDAARKLVYQDNVAAMVGLSLTRTALPVARLGENVGVPVISIGSTHPALTEGKRYVFRMPSTDSAQASIVAAFAASDLDAEAAAVLYDVASAYSTSVASVFQREFEAGGGRIVASETFTTGEMDYRRQLERIRDAEPDVIFLPSYRNEVRRQVEQARTLGLDAMYLGTDSWEGVQLPDGERAFFSYHWHRDAPREETRRFSAAYREAYNAPASGPAGLAYDATRLVLSAIEQQGRSDPESIRRGLAAMTHFDGASGSLTYGGTGDPIRDAVILSIDGGVTRFYRHVAASQ